MDDIEQLIASAGPDVPPLIDQVLALHEAIGTDRLTALLDVVGSPPETEDQWVERLGRRIRELQEL